ncbi:MAG: SRPBCC family protein [Acidimicrobiales bacterium]
MTGTFSCSIEVDAPPATVFDYFIDAELLVSWIGDYALLDAQPGGEFTLDIEGIPVRGRYLEVVAPKRVVVSWGHAGSETLPPNSTEVQFTLTATTDGGTLVEVEHRNLPDEQLPSHRAGWPMFMDRLRSRFPT